MRVEINIENFEKIYNETYSQILKFIIKQLKVVNIKVWELH